MRELGLEIAANLIGITAARLQHDLQATQLMAAITRIVM
jgi:hypothetical protein